MQEAGGADGAQKFSVRVAAVSVRVAAVGVRVAVSVRGALRRILCGKPLAFRQVGEHSWRLRRPEARPLLYMCGMCGERKKPEAFRTGGGKAARETKPPQPYSNHTITAHRSRLFALPKPRHRRVGKQEASHHG
jgi:hypothetical protein